MWKFHAALFFASLSICISFTHFRMYARVNENVAFAWRQICRQQIMANDKRNFKYFILAIGRALSLLQTHFRQQQLQCFASWQWTSKRATEKTHTHSSAKAWQENRRTNEDRKAVCFDSWKVITLKSFAKLVWNVRVKLCRPIFGM